MTIAKESKRILSVTVKREVDTDPDTSYYGEYSDTPDEYAIVNIGEYAGDFVKDLPCECGHDEDKHYDGSDPNLAHDEGQCLTIGCECEEFDRVGVERGREYRYFNPSDNYKGESDEDIRKYTQQDYDRMTAYNNQQWCYVGVYATADYTISSIVQSVRSGGLWGTESDSEESYFAEIAAEELSTLKDELHAIGFTKRAINAAFRNVINEND